MDKELERMLKRELDTLYFIWLFSTAPDKYSHLFVGIKKETIEAAKTGSKDGFEYQPPKSVSFNESERQEFQTFLKNISSCENPYQWILEDLIKNKTPSDKFLLVYEKLMSSWSQSNSGDIWAFRKRKDVQEWLGKCVDPNSLSLFWAWTKHHPEVGILELMKNENNVISQDDVKMTLIVAAEYNYSDLAKQCLALTGDNKPSQDAVEEALFSWAMKKEHVEIIKQCLALTGDNKPRQYVVEQALLWAVEKRHDEIIKQCLALTGDNKL